MKASSIFKCFFLPCAVFITMLPAAAQPLRVPVMVGQTGSSASFGKGETDAYRMAAEDWNARGGVRGRSVELLFEDTQTDQKAIVSGFHRFALSKPAVIMGPTWLDGFQAIIPLAKAKGILLVTPSAAAETLRSNVSWPITFYYNSTVEAKALHEALSAKGFSKIALLYESEPFAEMFQQLMKAQGLNPSFEAAIQTGDVELRAVVTRMMTTQPEALVILVWDERSLLTLFQQLRTLAPNLFLATIHDGEGWLGRDAFKNFVPQLMHTKFTVADPAFIQRFEKRFGYTPVLTATNAYDALDSVLKAFNSGATTGQQIREFLLSNQHDTVTFGRVALGTDGGVATSRVEIREFRS